MRARETSAPRGEPGARGVLATDALFPPLVCPLDQAPLEERAGALVCRDSHSFPVRGGVPRLVCGDGAYADAFGEQWNTYRTTQLDSFTRTTISRDRLARCLGEALWQALDGDRPLDVLEAGCGAGRFTEALLERPAARVTSTDLSSAVDANAANCPPSARHRVVQCDLQRFPFAPESFDVVVCLGVVQHTPDPEASMACLYHQVKPGGWLVLDHYAPSLAHYTKLTALALRPVLKRLPPKLGRAATERLTRLFFPLHRLVRRRPLLRMAVSRVSPLLTYYHAYPQLDHGQQFEWTLVDTHDSLTDYYKHLRTAPQVAAALDRLGAVERWVATGGNGVEARCRKPPRAESLEPRA